MDAAMLKDIGFGAAVVAAAVQLVVLFVPANKRQLIVVVAVALSLFTIAGIVMAYFGDQLASTARRLSPEAQERVASKVCAFGSQPFNELIVSGSNTLFMGQVEHVWQTCHWGPTGLSNRDAVVAATAQTTGVRFLYDKTDPKLASSAETFGKGLRAEGIATIALPTPDNLRPDKKMIIIVYGSRP